MYYGFFPLTPIMIIALALLDDVPIMTIAFDNALVPAKPVKWHLQQMLTVASVLGLLAVIQSFALLYMGDTVFQLGRPQLQTMMFLQLVAGGHLVLFVTRTRHAFWTPPYPNARLFWAIIATQAAAVLMCGFGLLVPQLTWRIIGLVWVYNLVWMIVLDVAKLLLYRIVDGSDSGATWFGKVLQRPLGPHAGLHHRAARTSPVD
jgi:H+-transporting ATPase